MIGLCINNLKNKYCKVSFIKKIKLTNEYVNLAKSYFRDMKRYAKYACIGWNRFNYDKSQTEGRIIAMYHVIEKGLAMPNFRSFFGVNVVKSLIKTTQNLKHDIDWSANVNYLAALKVIDAYYEKHKNEESKLSNYYTEKEIAFMSTLKNEVLVEAGVTSFAKEDFFEYSRSNFELFAKSRHSCRHFDKAKEVKIEQIIKAVDIARHSPSVCNRQCWKCHIYQDEKKVNKILKLQNGTRGFGQTINSVIVVTSTLKVFESYLERNQSYIDGGLFSMSLMYALHYKSIGCVPLNWCSTSYNDNKLRSVANIPKEETIIMLLGIGIPESSFKVPISYKRKKSEIIKIH